MKYRTDHGCEPCGECPWCRREAKAMADRFRLRREVAALRRLLAKSIVYMRTAAESDEGEVTDPHAAAARRFIVACRRRLRGDGRPR